MSKRQVSSAASGKAVSLERGARLCRLLRFLGTGAKSRAAVLKKLRIDIRTFYRDLELLRECAINVSLADKRYALDDDPDVAILRLPFPDPGLTLGEAARLAKGRTVVHRKLKTLLDQIMK